MEGPGQVGTPGPRPGSAAAPRHGPGQASAVPDPADPLVCVPQEAYEEGMRRSLDPEGYEDPGLKSSHLSLGEMSSEWLWGAGGTGGVGTTGVALHGHQCHRSASNARVWQSTGTGVAEVTALHV